MSGMHSRFSYAVAIFGALLFVSLQHDAAAAGTREGINAFHSGKYDTALKELVPAAKAEDADALYTLGLMYSAGKGVEKDQKQAVGYFAKAAELGNRNAQQSYGEALMLGEGVEQNMLDALKWFVISARAGNKEAATYAANVGKFMTREMQADARMQAAEWEKAFKSKKEAGGN